MEPCSCAPVAWLPQSPCGGDAQETSLASQAGCSEDATDRQPAPPRAHPGLWPLQTNWPDHDSQPAHSDAGAATLPRSRTTIRQQIDDSALLQIAKDGSVTLTLLPCPLIDSENSRRRGPGWTGWLTKRPEQCRSACKQPQLTGQSCAFVPLHTTAVSS
jgi:hypothetical protein